MGPNDFLAYVFVTVLLGSIRKSSGLIRLANGVETGCARMESIMDCEDGIGNII